MGKNQGKDNEMDILVEVSYRPLNHNEETDEIFYNQLGEASPWGITTYEISAGNKVQKRRISLRAWKFKCLEDNFLTQQVSEVARGDAYLTVFEQKKSGG